MQLSYIRITKDITLMHPTLKNGETVYKNWCCWNVGGTNQIACFPFTSSYSLTRVLQVLIRKMDVVIESAVRRLAIEKQRIFR